MFRHKGKYNFLNNKCESLLKWNKNSSKLTTFCSYWKFLLQDTDTQPLARLLSAHSSQGEARPQAALVTKQQLKADANPRDKARRISTDEETPIATQLPDDATATDPDGNYVVPAKTKKNKAS